MRGFQSPNHTQVPNDLFDVNLPDLEKAELKVLLVIIRYTLGYHKRRTRLSLRKMQALSGLSRNSVISAAEKLIALDLIERDSEGVSEWVLLWQDENDHPDMGVMGGSTIEPPLIKDGSMNAPLSDEVVQSLRQKGSVVEPPSIKEKVKENQKIERKDDSPVSYDQTPWVMVLSVIQGDHYQGNKAGWETSPWCQTWVVAGSDGHLVIGCTTEDDAAWLVDRGSAVARHALTGVLGRKVNVEFLGPAALQEVMADAA
jgi:phage replication O-like protein O